MMTPETLRRKADDVEHRWGDGGELREELYNFASAWEADRIGRAQALLIARGGAGRVPGVR